MKLNNPIISLRSESHLQEAVELFRRTGHAFGELDAEDLRISHDRSFSDGDLFMPKQNLTEKYFQINCYLSGIHCMTPAISFNVGLQGYREEIYNSIERLQQRWMRLVERY